VETLTTGIAFGESPRWGSDARLWFADWGAGEIAAVDPGTGSSQVMVELPSSSFEAICFDWLPDGRLVIASSREGRLLRVEADGSLATHADLNGIAEAPWNEVVVDGRGNAYVNNTGFDFARGQEFAPGSIALVTPDGSVRKVADGLAFPNGMAVTPDNATLICAESYGSRLTAFDIGEDGGLSNRRVWADLGDGAPDGICADAEGAVWYGDVPNRRCVRVLEGGEVIETVELELGCFACMLGGHDRRTLFLVVREWRGPESMADGARAGQILSMPAPAAGAGWP
jgi:sugar lactone lactonase YvrE